MPQVAPGTTTAVEGNVINLSCAVSSLPLGGNVINLAKVVIGKEFTTSVKTSVAATISRHAIFCGGRLPPLRRVLRCAVTGRFLKLMTLPLEGKVGRAAGRKRCPHWDKIVYRNRRTRCNGDTSSVCFADSFPSRGSLLGVTAGIFSLRNYRTIRRRI